MTKNANVIYIAKPDENTNTNLTSYHTHNIDIIIILRADQYNWTYKLPWMHSGDRRTS